MSWRNVSLGDVIALQRGHDLPEQKRRPGTVPVLGSAGINGYHDSAKADGPGVVIGRSGASFGEAHYTPRAYWPHNTVLYVKDFKGNHPRFVYYLLDSIDFASFNSGSAQPSLNRNYIYGLGIRFPDFPVQTKIAAILSAYDDLIENNTRRIKILEEMAQSIYREWFVNFRFPGHEKVKMVDSPMGKIPEGWEVKAFSYLADFVNGHAFKPTDWGTVGFPIIKIKELKEGVTAQTPRYGNEDLPPKYLIHNGDVLFSWSADLDVYYWSGGEGWLNQHLFNVYPQIEISKLFIFYALKDRMMEFRAKSLGTTMRHIKRSALDQVLTILPSKKICDQFGIYVLPMLDHIQNLQDKNRNLRQTRDLLLPKLISGELDVSELDIKAEEIGK
jgi:type I restriction enzyme, S subunit